MSDSAAVFDPAAENPVVDPTVEVPLQDTSSAAVPIDDPVAIPDNSTPSEVPLGGVSVRPVKAADRSKKPILRSFSGTSRVWGVVPTPIPCADELSLTVRPTFCYDTPDKFTPCTGRCTFDFGELAKRYVGLSGVVLPGGVDLRSTLIGMQKGITRKVETIGRFLTIDTETNFSFPESATWGDTEVTVAPAYAAAFTYITDETKLKAQQNIARSFEFASTNPQNLDRIFARCGELLVRPCNTVRFIFRLASLYLYSRVLVGPSPSSVFCTILLDSVRTYDLSALNSWAAMMLGDDRVCNFIPWRPLRGYSDARDRRFTAVLAMAAAGSIQLTNLRNGRRVKPRIWPEIVDPCLILPLRGRALLEEAVELDPHFIYEVAVVWAKRYSDISLFEEALQIVSYLMWSADGRNAATGWSRVALPLPEMNTAAFALAPVLQDMDNQLRLGTEEYNENGELRILEGAIASVAMGFSVNNISWVTGEAAIAQDLYIDDSQIFDSSLIWQCRYQNNVYSAGMQLVEGLLNHLGFNGQLGRALRGLQLEEEPLEIQKRVKNTHTTRIESFDLLAIAPVALRNTSVVGLIQPPVLPGGLMLNTAVFYSEVEDPVALRESLMWVKGVERLTVHSHRYTHELKSSTSPPRVLNRGRFIKDEEETDYSMADGSSVVHAIRISDPVVMLNLTDVDHDRYRLKWHVLQGVAKAPVRYTYIPGLYYVDRDGPNPDLPKIGGQKPKNDDSGGGIFMNDNGGANSSAFGGTKTPGNVGRPSGGGGSKNKNGGVRIRENALYNRVKEMQEWREGHKWAVEDLKQYQKQISPSLRPILRRLDACFAGADLDAAFMSIDYIHAIVDAASVYYNAEQNGALGLICGEMSKRGFLEWNMFTLLGVPVPKRAEYVQCCIEWYIYVAPGYQDMFSVDDMCRYLNGQRALLSILQINPELDPALMHLNVGVDRAVLAAEEAKVAAMEPGGDRDTAVLDVVLRNLASSGAEANIEGLEPKMTPAAMVIAQWMDDSEGKLLESSDEEVSVFLGMYATKVGPLGIPERLALFEHLSAILMRLKAKRALLQSYADDAPGFSGPRDRPDEDEGDDAHDINPGGSSSNPDPDLNNGGGSRQKRGGGGTGNSDNIRGGAYVGAKTNCITRYGGWETADTALRRKMYTYGGSLCFLHHMYGGKQPSAASSHESWCNSLSPSELAAYMVKEQYGCAGVEHFQGYYNNNWSTTEELGFETGARRKSIYDTIVGAGFPMSDISGDNWLVGFNKVLRMIYGRRCDRNTDMVQASLVGGMPIQLSAKMLLEAVPLASNLMELLHNMDPSAFEFEVTGTTLAICCLGPRLATQFLLNCMFDVPIGEWKVRMKGVLNRATRSQIFGSVKGPEVLKVRKIINVTIRRKEEAAMDVEERNRTALATPKTWFFHSASDWQKYGSPVDRYARRFLEVAKHAWLRIFNRGLHTRSFSTLQEFWDRRAMNVGSGSSTLVKSFMPKNADDRLADNDRPGKRFAVEYLDDDYLSRVLESPPVNRANYFVKPEPGKKLRALYSTHDDESYIAAYASQGQERLLAALPGMKVRQTPHDVVDWMHQSEGGVGSNHSPHAYWVSSDYSDYNAEHTVRELILIQHAACEALASIKNCFPAQVYKDKMASMRWVRDAYGTSWINWGLTDVTNWDFFYYRKNEKGDCGAPIFHPVGDLKSITDNEFDEVAFIQGNKLSRRMSVTDLLVKMQKGNRIRAHTWSLALNGMYSGSRDTARNNSMIHWVDVELAHEMVTGSRNCRIPMFSVNICGDDEDIKFGNLTGAIEYANHLAAVGHQLNPAKQLGGKNSHEFLQINWSAGGRAEKSLNALLATLASGNWYTQLGLWVQTAVDSCISNFWEAHLRGMPLVWAQRLVGAYLDRMMYIAPENCLGTPYEATGKRLEWWSYRNSKHLPPLFAGTAGEEARMPKFEAIPDRRPEWPTKASEALVRTQKALLNKLPKNYEQEFIDSVALDTVGAALKTWRQRDAKRWCARFWPERIKLDGPSADGTGGEEQGTAMLQSTVQPESVSQFAMEMPREKLVVTEQEVYARMGISMFVARKLGGLKNLGKHLTPEAWSKATNVVDSVLQLNEVGHRLQTNLRAVLSYRKVPDLRYQGSVKMTAAKTVRYVFMANGAGKSHFCRVLGGADDLDQLWCDLYGAFREDFDCGMPNSSFSGVAHVARDIIHQCQKSTGVLLGQLSPKLVANAVKKMVGVKMYYYDPGEQLRKERMARRGWEPEKIERRLRRARDLYAEAVELGWERLNDVLGIEDVVAAAERERYSTEGAFVCGREMQKYEYVFDNTELVTRQLKIMEDRGATPVF